MIINWTEQYERLKHEVTTNWKTGVGMACVTITVGYVYGKVAAMTVVVLTISNYDMIGRQMHIISWMSLKRTLFVVVMFGGNGYFNVLSPQLVSYLAAALLLIDNFQLSTVNHDLSTQNQTLEDNNAQLKAAYEGLKKLEEELQKLVKPAAELKEAQDENTAQVDVVVQIVPEDIQDLPVRLQNVNTLLKQLLAIPEMRELMDYEASLRTKVSAMLQAFESVHEQLKPLTEKVKHLSADLKTTTEGYQRNVTITGRQIDALNGVLEAIQGFPQRSIE